MCATKIRRLGRISVSSLFNPISRAGSFVMGLGCENACFGSQESNRNPGDCDDHGQTDQESEDVATDRLDAFVRMNLTDGAGRVVADAEWRSEQADAHGKDDDHCIMHFMN